MAWGGMASGQGGQLQPSWAAWGAGTSMPPQCPCCGGLARGDPALSLGAAALAATIPSILCNPVPGEQRETEGRRRALGTLKPPRISAAAGIQALAAGCCLTGGHDKEGMVLPGQLQSLRTLQTPNTALTVLPGAPPFSQRQFLPLGRV